MRSWFLKCAGLVLWGLFLFAPFIARADGFDTTLSTEINFIPSAKKQHAPDNVLLAVGGYELQFDDRDAFKIPLQDKWAIKLNAGKDTVMFNDMPEKIRADRVPVDDGNRKSMRFGVGLNYTF